MTKKEAKTTIHLRGGTSWLDQDSNKVGAYYTPAQRRILCLLVDKTPANGKKWQEFDVTQGRCSTRVGRLIFEAEVTEKTFYTALKKFDERGDVIVHVARQVLVVRMNTLLC